MERRAHAAGGGRASTQPRLPRQRQREPARGARGANRRRMPRPQIARGLGHDAGRDRLLPRGRRGARRAGRDPHGHAQRIGLRRGHARRLQGPRDSHLSHRRSGRRSRARHHQSLRRAARAPIVDKPDAPLHRQHDRRAPRHAHGLPPPRSGDSRGRGLRRVAYPARDDRRGGHPPRPRRDQHDVQRQPGDGSRGRPWAMRTRPSRLRSR